MLILPALAFALQTTISVGPTQGVDVRKEGEQEESRRIPVTEEMRRTAFKDEAARTLLLKARAARMTQDSMLQSYDAKAYQRISVGMGLRAIARERLAFRVENAARVRWQRGVGARIEVLGARAAVPIAGEDEMPSRDTDMIPIPYYPGKEQLWAGGGITESEVDDTELVHPIAEGSEAYYTFATGDSIIMTLPNGTRITLRELRITAREPRWNVTVGSFWFETSTAHLVRAVYRMSTPMDIWAEVNREDPEDMEDVPGWVRGLLTPMTADITSISVEYGLFNQRFWLPKTHGMEGFARVSFMRIPLKWEERFVYESVNGLDSLPAVEVADITTRTEYRDSLYEAGVDSAEAREMARAFVQERDSLIKARRIETCRTNSTYTVTETKWRIPTAVQFPCDSTLLVRSAELPPSIYDAGEDTFGTAERDELLDALTFDLQPGWSPQPPKLEYGLAFTRFNRIEGFSTGGALTHTLGGGYTTEFGLRGSLADMQLNGDASIMRSNGRRTLRATAYRRLVVSSDFGDPLSFGSSLGALLYARDEGFYHRAWGAELAGEPTLPGGLAWRLFAEQQWNAPVENRWSLFGGSNDSRFIGNVVADKAWLYGAGGQWTGSLGLDPRGWRLSTSVRAEAATGQFDYVRGLAETTVSRGLGPLAASVTAAAGTSGGTLPAQRHFFLGGLQTIRGQTAGSGYGESFWMGRLEIGSSSPAVKPVIFGDIGWAGPRDAWADVGRPLSGVGVGYSFLDGMIRVDLARGIHPRWQTRLDVYLEARF